MNQKIVQFIAMLLLMTIFGAACSDQHGVRPHRSDHHEIYYRNPWHRYERFSPPIYIGPPPVIEIPDIEFEAVPLPM